MFGTVGCSPTRVSVSFGGRFPVSSRTHVTLQNVDVVVVTVMNELEMIRRKQLQQEAIKKAQRSHTQRPHVLTYRGACYIKLLNA